jgi:hypothetical protein
MHIINVCRRTFSTYLKVNGSKKRQALGSSHLSLSAKNPDFGPKKCNNWGQKSAMHYKDHHVTHFKKEYFSKIWP